MVGENPRSVKEFLLHWNGFFIPKDKGMVRLFFGVALLWSIWLTRNNKIFKDKTERVEETFSTVKHRAWWWLKGPFPFEFRTPASCFFNSVEEVGLSIIKQRKIRPMSVWRAPERGEWKINIDGSARGKPGEAGVGGVIRDNEGNVLLMISIYIGVHESNFAELRALVEMFRVIRRDIGFPLPRIRVESDSSSLISWLTEPNSIPWRLHYWLGEILDFVDHANACSFSHIYREANSLADFLAKRGSSGERDMVAWI